MQQTTNTTKTTEVYLGGFREAIRDARAGIRDLGVNRHHAQQARTIADAKMVLQQARFWAERAMKQHDVQAYPFVAEEIAYESSRELAIRAIEMLDRAFSNVDRKDDARALPGYTICVRRAVRLLDALETSLAYDAANQAQPWKQ